MKTIPPLSPTESERFWKYVNKTNECWEWTRSKVFFGYGAFSLRGKQLRAHRVSWVMAFGEIPDGLNVLHKCDNPACVRPNHLFLGTHKDNADDRQAKGRCPGLVGESNPTARLTEKSVVEIRKRYSSGGTSQERLAAEFGVSPHTVQAIVNYETWKHVKAA